MTRRKLPTRRDSSHTRFRYNDGTYNVSASRFDDLRLGEVWIDGAKAGTDVYFVMIELATVMSLALQHGADPDQIRRALPQTRSGKPLGPLGCALDALKEPHP